MRSGEHIALHLSGLVARSTIDFATWKDRFPHHIEIAENKVSDACRYRVALPLGRIKITYREDSDDHRRDEPCLQSGHLTHMGEASIQLPKIDAPAAWNDRRCRWINQVRSPSAACSR